MTSLDKPQSAGLCIQLVLDSNIFIHCKQLQDLRWSDVDAGAAAFEIIVTREVVREIDQLKHMGNRRKARRARRAATLLKSLLKTPSGELVICNGTPRVALRLAEPVRVNWDEFPDLDPKRADERIIAEALEIQAANGPLVLVTSDVAAIHNARSLGVAYFDPPGDWLLPQEPDERDRKIQELEDELAKYQRSEPNIAISVLDGGDDAVAAIAFDVVSAPPLTSQQIEKLTTLALSQYPPADVEAGERFTPAFEGESPGELLLRGFRALSFPTEFEVKQYRESNYPAFTEEVRDYFSALTKNLIYRSRFKRITVRLASVGRVPAEKVVCEIKPLGDFGVYGDTSKPPIQLFPMPPPPPAAPFATFVSLFRRKPQVSLVAPNAAPEPEAFYWRLMPRDCDFNKCSLTCEQFRHETVFDLDLYLFARGVLPKGALLVRALAMNMPVGRKTTVKVQVRERRTTVLELAREEGLSAEVIGLLEQVLGSGSSLRLISSE